MHFRLPRTPFARSSSVRQPGAIVSSVKVRAVRFGTVRRLTATPADGDRSSPDQLTVNMSAPTDILLAGNSPARYPAHRHYASCADPTNCTLPAADGGAAEQCLSLWRIGELAARPFQLELAQFAMRDAKHGYQQQNLPLFTD